MPKAKPTILKIKPGVGKSVQPVAPAPAAPAPLPELAQVTNPSTKSRFWVLGRSKEGLRVSIRFVPAHALGMFRVMFRVRVGDQDRGDYIQNVYDHMKKRHPEVHFTATPVSTPDKRIIYPHASIEGVLQMEHVQSYDAERVGKALDESPFIEELWYAAMVAFATESYEMDREQFGRWIKQQLLNLCHEKPKTVEKPARVIYNAPGFLSSMKAAAVLSPKAQKAADLADAGLS
jgi:hypothetical protein